VVILLCVYIFYVYDTYKPVIHKRVVETPIIQAASQQPNIAINVERGGDDRYIRAPKPLRNWLNPVDAEGSLGTIPVMATRGLPESYQSMGIVKTSSGELLPLYGRRVASRSDRFNYYTRSDTNNPIPLPINYKKRDCQDDVGCDELYDGDSVEIIPSKQNGTVTIYRFNGPTYIPSLI
jgi:hypothetical protein